MTASMTVLALVTDAFGGRGGIARYNQDFLSSLAKSQTVSSIAILARHAPDQFILPDRIKQMPPQRSRIAYALRAFRIALREPVDVVFCGHLHIAPLAVLIAYICRAKLIVQMHGVESWVQPTVLRRCAAEAANLILCVSRHTRACVLQWATIAPEKVVVLPNTVADCFTPGDGSVLRSAWNIQGKRVLLSVGRLDALERYKGHDLLIQLIPRLVRAGHDVVWVVVGEGDDLPRLKSLARDLGVMDQVRFMGALTQGTLVNAYRMADLFVLPSTGEGFGIAFLEAMACGTPALGLAVAGALDALADGELGTTVAEGEFESALSRALVQPKAVENLSAAVRMRFGREPFAARAHRAMDRLTEAA
ncbi:MAG: glycosyltransferase family 4 protein [Deltaproteobacteria bacterium]|nr:glycosyltransferase family 4 protein [Deltaproteobacteria bacterium]